MKAAFVFVCLVALLGCCARECLATEQDPQLSELAAKALSELTSGNYAAFCARMEESVKPYLTEAKLREAWEKVTEHAGAFISSGPVRQEKNKGFRYVIIAYQFEKATFDVRLVFNSRRQISGIVFAPGVAPAQGAGPWIGYSQVFQRAGEAPCDADGGRYCHDVYKMVVKIDEDQISAFLSLVSEVFSRSRGNYASTVQHPVEFYRLDLSKLVSDTSLETDTGKRLNLLRYVPPSNDSAEFIFKSKLPDGTSFITIEDKELRFKTQINDRKINVKIKIKNSH
jgi:hypothetical protein